MKKLILISSLFFSVQSFAQEVSYADSTITLTLTQRCTYWIGQYVRTSFQWSERNAPTQIKNYIGSGSNPDSVIASVTFKAKYLLGALDGLISSKLQMSYTDYRSIVLNNPAIAGYTSLTAQIVSKANGSSSEKNVAAWLRDKYQERTAIYDALYNEQLQEVIRWSRN